GRSARGDAPGSDVRRSGPRGDVASPRGARSGESGTEGETGPGAYAREPPARAAPLPRGGAMSGGAKTIVTVEIAGEEYTIRSEATPDYTLQCARYLDETISQIERQSGLVEVQKAVILAALSLT